MTSIIPTPYTSPVFNGEFPIIESPCDEDIVKAAPFKDEEDCVASHQWIIYLPDSRIRTVPVDGS
ncbi:hypothetical protein [Lacrimispora brassicae]